MRSQPFVKLSGGQKQKMLIAIALGRDARVLVMDEPAANLDPEARKIFFELLAERQHDATMLISSHRLNEVASLVNRVVELDMGRVVLDDRVADDVSLSGVLDCRIRVKRAEPAFAKALTAWDFRASADGLELDGRSGRPRPPALPRHDQPLRRADRRPLLQREGKSQRPRDGGMIARRHFLALSGGLLLAPLAGCGKQGHWPEGMAEIKWDRDTCARCNMVISDPRFAAEMRGGEKGAVFKFDDIGCLVFWLRDKAAQFPWMADAAHAHVGGRRGRHERRHLARRPPGALPRRPALADGLQLRRRPATPSPAD